MCSKPVDLKSVRTAEQSLGLTLSMFAMSITYASDVQLMIKDGRAYN